MLLLIILLTPFTDQIICFVKQIIEDTDLVLCFIMGTNIHLSSLSMLQKEAGIDAVIYDLPGLHEKQMKSFEQKRMM